MKIKFKIKHIIFTILISLTFITIGFSTWNILIKDEIKSQIITDKIINSSDYIFLDKTKGDFDSSTNEYKGFEMFNYSEVGFIDKNGSISNTAQIKVYFRLDINKCKEIFSVDSPLFLKFTIKYNNKIVGIPNIFKDDGNSRTFKHKIEATEDINLIEDEKIVSDYSYVVPVKLTDVLQKNFKYVDFVLTYDLFAVVGKYFTDNIYQVLYGNNIEEHLVLETLITGEVKE